MDNYILYHATNIKAGNDIIEKQSFDIKEDKDNTELLGEGAYYYNNRQDALEWNSKKIYDNIKMFPEFKEMKDAYCVIKSEIEVESKEVLNLDDRDNIIKFKTAIKTIKNALKDIDNYNDKNPLGTIINFLYLKEKMAKKMIVKTIAYPIPRSYGIKINKKVYCIKDKKIILNYEITNSINLKEYKTIKELYS